MTEYEKGAQHYKNDGKVTGIHGTFSSEFHRGYITEERITRGGYTNKHWNKTSKVKSY